MGVVGSIERSLLTRCRNASGAASGCRNGFLAAGAVGRLEGSLLLRREFVGRQRRDISQGGEGILAVRAVGRLEGSLLLRCEFVGRQGAPA